VDLRLSESAKGVEIGLKVVPRAKKPGLDGLFDGRLRLRLAAPPADGRANQEAILLLASLLSVPRDWLELIVGATSRQKVVRVRNLTATEVQRRLDAHLSKGELP
jgi:uncharacterized protein (TIGR00251 family)